MQIKIIVFIYRGKQTQVLPSFAGAGTATLTGASGTVRQYQTHVRVHQLCVFVAVLAVQLITNAAKYSITTEDGLSQYIHIKKGH